jgi:hypothetical protein
MGSHEPAEGPDEAVSRPSAPATRRDLLKAGTGLAASLAGASAALTTPAIARETIDLPKAPNIIVLMTDQERHHMAGGLGGKESARAATAEEPRPLLQPRLYGGLPMLAVARADDDRSVLTGESCDPDAPLARLGAAKPPAEYCLAAQGEGRLRGGLEGQMALELCRQRPIGNGGEDWTADDIRATQENFGWSGWNPPDAGNAIETRQPTEFGTFNGLATLGGANPDNDGRYIMGPTPGARSQTPGFGESVVDFLKNRAPGSASRFACSYRWSTRTTSMSTRPVGRRRATGMRTLPISVSSCRPTTATTS